MGLPFNPRSLARELKQPTGNLELRQGVVISIQTTTCTITLGGSSTQIPNVKWIGSYSPVVNDTVWILKNGPDLIVIGVLGPAGSGGTPTGEIKFGGWASAPVGYLACDGASYLRTDYPALFAAIGTAYGAVDGTHFSVPDLRNRTPMGTGNGGPALGAIGGTPQTTATDPNTGHTHAFAAGVNTFGITANHTHLGGNNSGTATSGVSNDHGHSIAGITTGGASISANHSHSEQGLGVLYVIKT